MPKKTKERAYEIINIYLKALETVKSVKSVILVGSLSDDTYTGNAGSDIDLVHIIYDRYDYESEKKKITDLISGVERETDNDVPISKTVFSEFRVLKLLVERPKQQLHIQLASFASGMQLLKVLLMIR